MKKLLFIFLVMLALIGCKTKEKVTERMTERTTAYNSSVAAQAQQAEQQTVAASTSENVHTVWSDSVVEKTYDRVVTDSTGRVLLHEREQTRERYKRSGQRKSQQAEVSHETSSTTSEEIASTENDSIRRKEAIKKDTTVKTTSWRWLWFVVLLAVLIIVGMIISKVTRR